MDIFITLTMKETQRYEIIQKLIGKKITEEEARKSLRLKSVRQVRRIKRNVLKNGIQGVINRSRGKPSNRALDEAFREKVIKIMQEKYSDFKPTFAAEKLLENEGIKINKETLRLLMIHKKLWNPKSRKKPKERHEWRERKSNYGEMQQFDGSYHKWFEGRGEEVCLLVSIDDATGRITKAHFGDNEGVEEVFKFWKEYIETHGTPLIIYLDKFSTYKINHPLAKDNSDFMTQYQRAMNQLGVQVIHAHSPQAKGRVERSFQTLQDRLIKELRLAKISTKKEANEFLKTYIPKYNERFSVVPKNQSDLHKNLDSTTLKLLPQIFSKQASRKVNNDYTVMFKNQFYQLQEIQPTTVFKKDKIIVEEHLNGELKIRLKNHYLNFQILPKRPKKTDIQLCALTRQHSGYIPPKNHPWRTYKYSPEEYKNLRKNNILTPA